jgi:hypothetical protein
LGTSIFDNLSHVWFLFSLVVSNFYQSPGKWFMLLWLVFFIFVLTICQKSDSFCCGWFLCNNLVYVVVAIGVIGYSLTICQRSGSCCDLLFWPFAREVIHVVVVIFDQLPEKWFMLWWLFLTICQRRGSCCDLLFLPFAREVVHAVVVIFYHLPEKWFMFLSLFLFCCWQFAGRIIHLLWLISFDHLHVVVQSPT